SDSAIEITGFLLYDHSQGTGRKVKIKSGGLNSSTLKVNLGMGFFTSRYDVTFIIFGKNKVSEEFRRTSGEDEDYNTVIEDHMVVEDNEETNSINEVIESMTQNEEVCTVVIEEQTEIKDDHTVTDFNYEEEVRHTEKVPVIEISTLVEESTMVAEDHDTSDLNKSNSDVHTGSSEEAGNATKVPVTESSTLAEESDIVTNDHDTNAVSKGFDNENSANVEEVTIISKTLTEESDILNGDNDDNCNEKVSDNVDSNNDEELTNLINDKVEEDTSAERGSKEPIDDLSTGEYNEE
ncbi:unnamed protein product, partial [Meganyctiphanes norvegica]